MDLECKRNRPKPLFSKNSTLRNFPSPPNLFTCDDNVEFFLMGIPLDQLIYGANPSFPQETFSLRGNFPTAGFQWKRSSRTDRNFRLAQKTKLSISSDQVGNSATAQPTSQRLAHREAPQHQTVIVVGKYGDGPWGNLRLPRKLTAGQSLSCVTACPPQSPPWSCSGPKDNPPTLLRHRGEYTSLN